MENYWIVDNDKLNPQTQEILNEYLLINKLGNKSELTIEHYHRFLERVFITITKPLGELTSDDILDYFRSNYINIKESSIRNYIGMLSTFFNFCLTEGYIDQVLVKSRWIPRVPMTIPKYLDKSELAKVKLEAEKLSLRDRTIFEFLLTSGSRLGEVVRLNVEDVDLVNRTAEVLVKAKRVRTVHFSETCAILIEQCIKSHPEKVGPLFLGKNNSRIAKGSIYFMIKNLGEKASLSKRISPNCMRNTFATMLFSRGAPMEFIATELGHKSFSTIRIYATLPQAEIFKSIWYTK